MGNFLRTYTTYQGWWGEGDTIFRRDGKSITHSPGTEDEYGSTWGFGEKTFAFGACGHIENVEGRNLMYRWTSPTPFDFAESLHVEIQNQRYDKGQVPSDDDYISVAYWYLDRLQPMRLDSFSVPFRPEQGKAYHK